VSEFGEVKRELAEIKLELRLLRGDLMAARQVDATGIKVDN
jgi:hypothetical protein